MVLAGYLAWRVAVDSLKPQPLLAGMSVIQWACIGGLLALGVTAIRVVRATAAMKPEGGYV